MRCLTALGVLLLVPLSLAAGPLEAQPDFIEFGRVNVGAVAEASVMVRAAGADTAGHAVKIVPPPFVSIDNIHVRQRDYGDKKTVECSFHILLDTRKAGELKGEVAVEFAGGKYAWPVSASVVAPKPGQTRVLIVETPFHIYSTDDAKIFRSWLELQKAAEFDVQYWLVDRSRPVLRGNTLDNFDVVLLDGNGLHALQDEDRKRLKRFVELGGRLVVGANHFFQGSVERANALVGGYGMKLHDEEQAFGQGAMQLGKDRLAADPLTKDIDSLYFHRASPISVTDPKKAKLLTRFDDDVGVIAVARLDPGEVILMGDSMWWLWINRQGMKADNAKMLRLMLTKPPK
jgi:hypothetical protein